MKAIFLLKAISRKIIRIDLKREYDIITTIPTYWFRRLKRFIHPADIVAKALSQKKGIAFGHVLKRCRFTKYQWTLNRSERFKNVKKSFKLCDDIRGLNILLVDDIFTSGATLNEAALMLKRGGAKIVDCYILAKSGI
jgi:ComF family protein